LFVIITTTTIIIVRYYYYYYYYYFIFTNYYLDLRIQFFKHIHAWILSEFKDDHLFVIRSLPPEKTRSTGTLVPIYKRKII